MQPNIHHVDLDSINPQDVLIFSTGGNVLNALWRTSEHAYVAGEDTISVFPAYLWEVLLNDYGCGDFYVEPDGCIWDSAVDAATDPDEVWAILDAYWHARGADSLYDVTA